MASYPRPGESFGPYTIVDTLGQGGMGAVFRAVQTTLNRQVALKVLLPHQTNMDDFRERFTREAAALAAMDSPHIISIYDFGEHNDCLFIATQLVAGGDLGRHLATNGAMPLPLALTITEQVASALAAAHQANVIHRDVKPTNVLLGERAGDPHAYLCDFGIARGESDGLTQTGTVVGTYAYLAPERINGAPATPASDIYALGCLLVAVITGRSPYLGTDMQVAQQHQEAPIPQWDPTSPILARLNDIVRTAMAKDPRARFASALDMRRELLAVRAAIEAPGGGTVPATTIRPDVQPTRAIAPTAAPVFGQFAGSRPRRWPLLVGVTVAAIALAGIGTAVALTLGSSDDGANGPTASPSAPRRTSSTPATQASGRTCLDGRKVGDSVPCGEPQGQRGLEAVFPTMPAASSCKTNADRLDTAQRKAFSEYRQCDQRLLAGNSVRVTYVGYTDYPTAAAFLAQRFGAGTTDVGDGVVQYAERTVGNGFEVVRMYGAGSPHPFSAAVACGRPARCLEAIALVSFLPASRFDD